MLHTKINCIKEGNKDVKEKLLRSERENHFITPLFVLNNWATAMKGEGILGHELNTNSKEI